MNNYDEIKNLLKKSQNLLKNPNKLQEEQESILRKHNLLKEQEDTRLNLAQDIEDEIVDDKEEIEGEPSKADKKQSYRISGGVLTIHSKDFKDLELTTEDKQSFQETMEEFVDNVTNLVEFEPLNIYPNDVQWSGKIIDLDIEFFFSIGENNGIYINTTMTKIDENYLEMLEKLKQFYEKFKAKWSQVIGSRKKTKN